MILLVCPLCRGGLEVEGDARACGACGRVYPSQHGIPDLRVFPDPHLGFDKDRERTEAVVAALERHDLAGLLRRYWSLSDTTPAPLRERFVAGALRGAAKARRILRLLEDGALGAPLAAQRVLEIGSGSGAFLGEAAPRFEQVVGLDIGMRWLHLSRRRFLDSGKAVPPLVCACADHLPFPDRSFDLVVLLATLECTRDPGRVLAECARVLAEDGCLFANAVNRFSLAEEPHVGLWGVGFLPGPWQGRYVRWRRKVPFELRLLSFWGLDRLARRHFPRRVFLPADIDDESLAALPAAKRLQVRAYRLAKRLAPLRLLLTWFGPEWDIALRKA